MRSFVCPLLPALGRWLHTADCCSCLAGRPTARNVSVKMVRVSSHPPLKIYSITECSDADEEMLIAVPVAPTLEGRTEVPVAWLCARWHLELRPRGTGYGY